MILVRFVKRGDQRVGIEQVHQSLASAAATSADVYRPPFDRNTPGRLVNFLASPPAPLRTNAETAWSSEIPSLLDFDRAILSAVSSRSSIVRIVIKLAAILVLSKLDRESGTSIELAIYRLAFSISTSTPKSFDFRARIANLLKAQ
jgi:hypothetical protein